MFSPYLSVIQSSNIPIDSTEAEHGEEREGDVRSYRELIKKHDFSFFQVVS